MVRYRDSDLSWLGYATIRLAGDRTVYLDPGRYGVLDGYDARDGDVVCVTHDHHYDPDGIRRVAEPDATIVVYEGVDAANIDRDVTPVADLDYDVVRVGEDATVTVDGVRVRSLPVYNRPDGPRDTHPPGFGVGYLVTVGDARVLWTGDSDALPHHDDLDVDVLCPPVGGSFTMNREDAAALAERMKPDLVVPVHYDTFAALETDADAFVTDVARRGIGVALNDSRDQ
ncbi:MBL fold metallo-hydrolase [Salarchaeum sp. JOR-1]|uniref:MBL fold metallo-hydrolase n=1 Tax=Salarchaeum sp. JOR-1 TaxID=2599399 RepID=UPI001198C935|nr:MBL fold metallo-hydrolase [Salarchaeum sp. JOR-1]QDX41055.1 MBL fold metallo-hydrolase [Salarchaeum sp. JOR-1]